MSLVFLILGGNQGNRAEIISSAINLVTKKIGEKKALSALYESESWGFLSEPFINQVIILETTLSPEEVLMETQQIENQLGRTRNSASYEARTIDIDLLYYDSVVMNGLKLILPHPRMTERRFVLVPLAEAAPDWIDPISQKSMAQLLEVCSDKGKVWLYKPPTTAD